MKEEQPHTQSDISKDVPEDQQEELQFQAPQDESQLLPIVFCIGVTVTIIILALFKLASVISTEYPVVFIAEDQEVITVSNTDFQSTSDVESITSANVIVAALESSYQEIALDGVKQHNIIRVQNLNQNHVQFKRTLRKIDYNNAEMQLQGLLDQTLTKNTDITYGQFLQALRRLQLTTLPPNDFSEEPRAVQQQQYNAYKQKWKLWSAQDSVCSVLLLSETGLNTGNYYYAIRGLFQQRYANMKIVVVDNTPKLGLQAEVLGLIKQLSEGRDFTIIDKKKGEGTEASSIYYAIHKYCKDSQLTIILKDNGQIIGQYAFALLNEIHQKEKVPLVISHYLLDSGNLYTNLQNDFRYKVQIYPEYKDSLYPRRQPYKTKYLKSYKTQLLLSLPLSIFQNSNGFWLTEHMEVYLQYAALQKSCGRHYVLPQILYRVPKSQVQSISTVSQARHSSKVTCKDNIEGGNQESQFQKKYKLFESNLIPVGRIVQFTPEQARQLEDKLLLADVNRAKTLKMMISNQKVRLNHGVPAVQKMSSIPKQAVKRALQEIITNSAARISKSPQTSQLQSLTSSSIPTDSNQMHSDESLSDEQRVQQSQFCIILETHNNFNDFGYFYSIQSVLQQIYQFYRLVIFDNASTDHTLRAIKWQLSSVDDQKKKRLFVYGAKQQRAKGQSLYFIARQFCQPDDIMIFMQAGEQLIGRLVLQKINQQYRKGNLLAAYSNNLHYNHQGYSIGISREYERDIIQNKRYRESPLLFGSLRSFKVAVFFEIAEEDFKWEGKWASDQLIFNISYAVLEMACERVRYINEILYRVNQLQKDFPSTKSQPLVQPKIPQLTPQGSTSSSVVSEPNSQLNVPSSNPVAINRLKAKYKCLSPKYLTFNP